MSDDVSFYDLPERDRFRRELFDSIYELSDFELQKLTWLRSQPLPKDIESPHWSFVEFIECYWDVVRKDDALKEAVNNEFLSTPEADEILPFQRLLDAYRTPNGAYDHPAILEDPQWQTITSSADTTRKALLKSVSDPAELECLAGSYFTRIKRLAQGIPS